MRKILWCLVFVIVFLEVKSASSTSSNSCSMFEELFENKEKKMSIQITTTINDLKGDVSYVKGNLFYNQTTHNFIGFNFDVYSSNSTFCYNGAPHVFGKMKEKIDSIEIIGKKIKIITSNQHKTTTLLSPTCTQNFLFSIDSRKKILYNFFFQNQEKKVKVENCELCKCEFNEKCQVSTQCVLVTCANLDPPCRPGQVCISDGGLPRCISPPH